MRDRERMERVERGLREENLDALVCALPSNVLLLTGYWPVVGTSVAVVTRAGEVGLALPEDEGDLADGGWAEVRETFSPGSLDGLPTLPQVLAPSLSRVLHRLGMKNGRLGYEHGPILEPGSYAGTNRYSAMMPELVREISAAADVVPADQLLLRLRAVLTRRELARLRLACRLTGDAFRLGARSIVPGATEHEVAAAFRAPLEAGPAEDAAHARVGGYTFCMSGPNAALAYKAYARSRGRRLRASDLVLVHCNAFLGGFWTDVTRTYHFGSAEDRTAELFELVLKARRAALDAVAPGATGREVDRAAREVLATHRAGNTFRHGTGHGVGFAAIDHQARPRIHPASDDVLETGMVFNLEPALYLEGWGGLRHCEMAAVTAEGAELLTPFQSRLEELAPRLAVAR
jgi:Xaa-Pro aminopeptidase